MTPAQRYDSGVTSISRGLPLIAHADWSIDSKKRWLSLAVPRGTGYAVSSPTLLGNVDGLIERLSSQAGGRTVVAGFDFPIGLPAAYAKKARISSFRDFLNQCATGKRSSFFDIADSKDEIGLARPFYPRGVRDCRREHLTKGLGLAWGDLHRRCEAQTGRRKSACPLFWTLGGNQVGRGALHGWRWVVMPNLVRRDVAIWPFDGTMRALLSRPSIKAVIVETYPAEALCQLLQPPASQGSKRDQHYRQVIGRALVDDARELTLSTKLKRELLDGFGRTVDGEDRFDSAIGAMALARWAVAQFPHEPTGRPIRRIEGWIANQAQG